MLKNDVLEELYSYRQSYAKSFNYDLDAIVADLQKKQDASEREIIYTPLKSSKKSSYLK